MVPYCSVTYEPSREDRHLARTTVTDCNGYRKQQMTLVNILRMTVMFVHRRPLRNDRRKLNYHSVRGYPGLKLYMCSLVVGLPLDQE